MALWVQDPYTCTGSQLWETVTSPYIMHELVFLPLSPWGHQRSASSPCTLHALVQIHTGPFSTFLHTHMHAYMDTQLCASSERLVPTGVSLHTSPARTLPQSGVS